GGDVVADMLRSPHQDRYLVGPADHATIDADVHHTGVGIFGDHARISDEIAPAVEPVPVRDREILDIDVLAGDDILLAWTAIDDARGNALLQDGAADLDQLTRVRVGRQAEHHGDAALVVEGRAEYAAAAALRLVVVLDVVEQERTAGAGALRQSHDGAKLDVPVDLGVDLMQLARCAQRVHPAAQIATAARFPF